MIIRLHSYLLLCRCSSDQFPVLTLQTNFQMQTSSCFTAMQFVVETCNSVYFLYFSMLLLLLRMLLFKYAKTSSFGFLHIFIGKSVEDKNGYTSPNSLLFSCLASLKFFPLTHDNLRISYVHLVLHVTFSNVPF